MTPNDRALATAIHRFFAPSPPVRLGVAVSGGSDSMALLHLLAEWPQGSALQVVTVDHGLRPEAAAEAAGVAQACQALGLPHQILRWEWNGRGNLPDQARQGRLSLIAGWADLHGIGVVALGHTADDQAETFLMRLARGSGVDGLSAMSGRRLAHGVEWVRPMLGLRREDLRGYLTRRGVGWADDPTNADDAYQRVRARAAMAVLEPLGITPQGIADTVARLSLARDALAWIAQDAALGIARVEGGDIVLGRRELTRLPMETQLRLLAHAIGWVASAIYRPRLATLVEVHSALTLRKRRTLGGCLLTANLRDIRIAREWQSVRAEVGPTDALWDRRWRLQGPHSKDLHIAALGEAGLAACPGWRSTRAPRPSLLASPAIWRGTALVAAPLAGNPGGWQAALHRGDNDFFSSLISH